MEEEKNNEEQWILKEAEEQLLVKTAKEFKLVIDSEFVDSQSIEDEFIINP